VRLSPGVSPTPRRNSHTARLILWMVNLRTNPTNHLFSIGWPHGGIPDGWNPRWYGACSYLRWHDESVSRGESHAIMHIILCSDNPAMREAVQQSFAERADRLTVCESGMELLAAVKALVADLVILDLESHGLGGLLLAFAVQELAPGLRVGAVSLRAEVDTRPLMQRGVPYVRLGVDEDAGGRAFLAGLAGRSGAVLGASPR
jgi:CheY-like chemotaxis protein